MYCAFDADAGVLSAVSGTWRLHYLPVFMLSRLLIGMGSSPIISVGVTFINDCSTNEKFATYAGICDSSFVANIWHVKIRLVVVVVVIVDPQAGFFYMNGWFAEFFLVFRLSRKTA